ncbi:MAG: FAD-dependent oxidoreductase, partial [Actinobacteria bacterium]|nr:FAD-dependent oxidoreductase [Actinomycetota bacterium]
MGCALSRSYADAAPPDASAYQRISLWHETADTDWTPRPSLPGGRDVDVAIVGAGYTGLWTAYYLAEADPTLRIAVLEAEVAGFGASGRNGGWCSALFPASLDTLAAIGSRTGALAQHQAMRGSVREVARVAAAEGIDAHLSIGGTITLARSRPQLVRARREVAHARSWGRGEDDVRLLDAREARDVLRGSGTRGATYTP